MYCHIWMLNCYRLPSLCIVVVVRGRIWHWTKWGNCGANTYCGKMDYLWGVWSCGVSLVPKLTRLFMTHEGPRGRSSSLIGCHSLLRMCSGHVGKWWIDLDEHIRKKINQPIAIEEAHSLAQNKQGMARQANGMGAKDGQFVRGYAPWLFTSHETG